MVAIIIKERANIPIAAAIFIKVLACKSCCHASSASFTLLRVSFIPLPIPFSELNTPFADSATSATSPNVPFKVFNTLRNVPVFKTFIIVPKSIDAKAVPIPSATGFRYEPNP